MAKVSVSEFFGIAPRYLKEGHAQIANNCETTFLDDLEAE